METKTSIEKYPKSKAVIRFQDCDPLAHLNNAAYLDYFMNAREDHLKDFYDFDLYRIVREKGFAWVVAQNQIAYLKPALLMEEVVIKSSVIFFNESSIAVEMSMWDATETRLKSLLWSKFVSVDAATGKKINMPSFVTELLNEVLVDDVDMRKGFDARIAELLGK